MSEESSKPIKVPIYDVMKNNSTLGNSKKRKKKKYVRPTVATSKPPEWGTFG